MLLSPFPSLQNPYNETIVRVLSTSKDYLVLQNFTTQLHFYFKRFSFLVKILSNLQEIGTFFFLIASTFQLIASSDLVIWVKIILQSV